jgi:hypothetical protein
MLILILIHYLFPVALFCFVMLRAPGMTVHFEVSLSFSLTHYLLIRSNYLLLTIPFFFSLISLVLNINRPVNLLFAISMNFFLIVLIKKIDHDRPLSKSGELDAAKVSQKLQHLGWIPQLILSRWVSHIFHFSSPSTLTTY